MEFNPKCVAVSGVLVGAYWLLAPRDRTVAGAAAIAVFSYAGLAWYDKAYDCDDRLRSFGGLFGQVTAPLKPAVDAHGQYTGADAAGADAASGVWLLDHCADRGGLAPGASGASCG